MKSRDQKNSITLLDGVSIGTGVTIGDPNCVSDAPAYVSVVSDEEIIAVLSFIKSIWPKEVIGMYSERNAQDIAR